MEVNHISRMNNPAGLTGLWNDAVRLGGGRVGFLIAFGVLHYLSIWLGYELKENPDSLAWMWPGSGSLVIALVLAPWRMWPAVVLVQWGVEASFTSQMANPFSFGWSGWFLLANTLEGLIAASIYRALDRGEYRVSLRKMLIVLLATGTGAAAGGLLGAHAALHAMGHEDLMRDWQIWWAGNWLGSLVLAPLVYGWLVPFRQVFRTFRHTNQWEVPLGIVVLAPLTWWMFSTTSGQQGSFLQLPVFLTALLVMAAIRLPPRWTVTVCAMVTLIAVFQTANGFGPYAYVGGPFDAVVYGQFRLIMMVITTLIVVSFITERAMSTAELETSEQRYRSFIGLTSEAVARIELQQPMPVNLPADRQQDWFWQHARIAESNAAFDKLRLGPMTASPGAWRTVAGPFLAALAAGESRCDNQRLTLPSGAISRSFMVSLDGVVNQGLLERVWLVASDITQMVELNSRLLRDQERIKSYARQIISADERARRATAVDLHDGIAQSLVAMGMMLKALRSQSGGSHQGLIDEMMGTLRDVQEQTRTMVADLSPPGLYDLGLVPALQWLAVRFRSHDKLHVQLECDLEETSLSMELRILVFKLIRELLRNVVKHAGVDRAAVWVREEEGSIVVEVQDDGRGFEWQLDLFGGRTGGYGLWSIADRVADMGGEMNVESSPGRGSRFMLSFPTERRFARTGT